MINEIKQRLDKKSPKFFQKITRFCIVLGAVGGVLLTAPISLPTGLVALGGYLVTAGAVGGAISKLTVDHSENNHSDDENK